MKAFIYSAKHNKAKFGSNVTLTIYKLLKNKPIFLGEVFYNTGSYMGVEGEINKFLVINKHLPSTYVESKGKYYVNYDKYGIDKDYYFYSI